LLLYCPVSPLESLEIDLGSGEGIAVIDKSYQAAMLGQASNGLMAQTEV
jgi:hypothetical protein